MLARAAVLLGETLVGHLERVGDKSTFALDRAYLARAQRPVLGQRFEGRRDADARWVGIHNKLPSFFSHYLPECETLRAHIANALGVKPTSELELLSALGEDLPGALVVRPIEGALSADGLDVRLRFSLAGVQLKLSMKRVGDGFAFRADGDEGEWVVKLYGDDLVGAVENEYSTMTLARAAGIDAAECALIERAALPALPLALSHRGKFALAVRRFDRTARGRAHQEDFAQVFELSADRDGKYAQRRRIGYEHLAKHLAALGGERDVIELVRRLTFCMVLGNADAHLKNWSLLYDDDRARLSPAYDLVATGVYPRVEASLALRFFGERRIERIGRERFAWLAESAQLPHDAVLEAVVSTVAAIRTQWELLGSSLPLVPEHRAALDRRIRARWW